MVVYARVSISTTPPALMNATGYNTNLDSVRIKKSTNTPVPMRMNSVTKLGIAGLNQLA
jgi:hypothetical protein